jgi:hypothetical protein
MVPRSAKNTRLGEFDRSICEMDRMIKGKRIEMIKTGGHILQSHGDWKAVKLSRDTRSINTIICTPKRGETCSRA